LRRRGRYSLLAPVLAGVLISGCGGFFSSGPSLEYADPYLLFQRVREHAARLSTFEGRAEWTTVSEDGAFRGTTRVVLRSPDSLWLKMEGPFGIDMAIASITHGRFLVFSPMLKAAFQGNAAGTRMNRLLPFSPAFSRQLIGAAGLLVPQDSLLEDLTGFYPEKYAILLEFLTGDRIWIDRKGPVVNRWENRDSTGALRWVWSAERFQRAGALRLPRWIEFSTEPRQRLTLFYETTETNRNLHKGWCDVPIPTGVEPATL